MCESQNLEFGRRGRSGLGTYLILKKHKGAINSIMNLKPSKQHLPEENRLLYLIINQYLPFLCKICLFWVEELSPSQLNKPNCIHSLPALGLSKQSEFHSLRNSESFFFSRITSSQLWLRQCTFSKPLSRSEKGLVMTSLIKLNRPSKQANSPVFASWGLRVTSAKDGHGGGLGACVISRAPVDAVFFAHTYGRFLESDFSSCFHLRCKKG